MKKVWNSMAVMAVSLMLLAGCGSATDEIDVPMRRDVEVSESKEALTVVAKEVIVKKRYVKVDADKLNVRSGPTTKDQLVGDIKKDVVVEVVSSKLDEQNREWLEVALQDGTKGWVAGWYTVEASSDGAVLIVSEEVVPAAVPQAVKVEAKVEVKEEVKVVQEAEVKEEVKVVPEAEVKEEVKVEPEAEVKEEVKVVPEAEVKEEVKVEPETEVKEEVKVVPEAEVKEEVKVEPEAEVKEEVKVVPEAEVKEVVELAPVVEELVPEVAPTTEKTKK